MEKNVPVQCVNIITKTFKYQKRIFEHEIDKKHLYAELEINNFFYKV